METKTSKHQIEMTSEECYKIGCWIHYSIQHSIHEHYVNHPINVYEEQEKERLDYMDKFFALGNYGYLSSFHRASLLDMLTKKDK